MTGVSAKSSNGAVGNFGAYIFFLLYAAFVIYLCYTLNIWIDETYSANTSSYDLKGVIKQSYNFEGQPPAYFILLSWWRLINPGLFFSRLFSVLCTGLAAWVFYKTIKLIAEKNNAVWYTALFLLNPFTVWICTQMRLYAFLLMLAVLSLYFFFNFFKSGKSKHQVGFAVIAIAGIYTQYLYVFLLISLGVSVLLFKGWKTFFTYCLYLVPAALLFLQNILFTTNPMELAYVNSIQSSFSTRLISILHSPQNLLLASNNLSFSRIIRTCIVMLLVFLLLNAYFLAYKKSKAKDNFNSSATVIIISCTCLVFCIAIFFAVTAIDYNDKYLTIGFPLLILLLVMIDIYSVVISRSIILMIAVYYIILLVPVYRYPVNDFNSRALAAYITRTENKNEPILFYPKVLALPFQYYYKGKGIVVPLPDAIKFDSSYLSKIKDSTEFKTAMDRINAEPGSYLLITNRSEPHFANDPDIKMLNTYLPLHYTVTIDTLFYGKLNSLRVRRLIKK